MRYVTISDLKAWLPTPGRITAAPGWAWIGDRAFRRPLCRAAGGAAIAAAVALVALSSCIPVENRIRTTPGDTRPSPAIEGANEVEGANSVKKAKLERPASDVGASLPTQQRARPEPPRAAAIQVISAWSRDELRAQFAAVNYDLSAVRRGRADVPALLLRRLPADFPRPTRVIDHKNLFVQTVLPMVLESNRRVLADRARLVRIMSERQVSPADRGWLIKLAKRCRVKGGRLQVLLRHVDIIPPSIALAQAALESGWGRSRFALEGNALFGQRTWTPNSGMVPAERPDRSRFSVRRFAQLYDSVAGYMRNLNTLAAYDEFRRRRAELRERNGELSGSRLVVYLGVYSIEREIYVRKLLAIIRGNQLHHFDAARLRDGYRLVSRAAH